MADRKDIVKSFGGYGTDDSGSYVVADSRYPKYQPSTQSKGDSVGASKAAGALNRINTGSSVLKKDMGVWRGVNSAYSAHNFGQQSLTGLMDLMTLPNGSDVIVYDTEILGTAPHMRLNKLNANFYAPTEIGFQHVKLVNGEMVRQTGAGSSLSLLLRPNQDVYQRLDAAINDLASKNWSGLTDDMRRTLSDLTLYAGDTSKMFNVQYKDGRKITSVNQQSRHLRPLDGVALTQSDTISAMRRGLANLNEWGTSPEDAILEMNSFMKGFQNTRFAGYNVYNFDQPMMMDYLNSMVGKYAPDSTANKALNKLKNVMALNQIDGLHAVRTLYRDLHGRYGDATTLERMKDVFGLHDGGQSHHALSDVGTTIEQINRLLKDAEVAKTIATGGKKGSMFANFNDTTLKVGDRLFGNVGMMSKNAGEYDGIYRKKDGKFYSAYDMAVNPIYRNTSYRVQQFFDGIKIDGKTMFGVQLYNEDDDLHHTIFRQSHSELQQAIHDHLEYVDKRTSDHTKAHWSQNEDRARRRFNKMFSTESGGGIGLATRMYDALDVVDKVDRRTAAMLDEDAYVRSGMSRKQAKDKVKENKKRIAKMKRESVLRQSTYNTDEFYRDFMTMKGRLREEKEWISPAIDRIRNSSLKGGSDAGTVRVQNLAFAEYGKRMTSVLGDNTYDRKLRNGLQALEMNVDGEARYLTLNDNNSVRGALYGHLYKGHVDRPNMGIIRQRYRQMLLQLKSYNALEAKHFEKLYGALDGVRHDASLDNLLNDISNAVMRAKESGTLQGALSTINVEDPTHVRGARAANIGNKQLFHDNFESMISSSIDSVTPYTKGWGSGPLHIHGKEALDIIDTHDEAIRMLMGRNGLINKDGKSLVNGINTKIKSTRSSLAELAQAFTSQDMHVQFRYDGKHNGLKMVLVNKGVSESILDGSLADIMKSNHAAVIDLPSLMADGSLRLGMQNRTARFKARRLNQGGYELVTGFDEIINTLKFNAKTVRSMLDDAKLTERKEGKNNGMIQVHNYLNSKAKKAMMNLSMNNRFSPISGHDNPWETKSAGANWVRSGLIDISDVADEWYTGWYSEQTAERKKLWRLKTPDEVRELASKNGELFVNSMGMDARRVFQRQSDDYWNGKTGMNLGMHSVKDVHVSNYLRANLDARQLLAFGYYNPMARENIMKTVNYAAMDEATVRERLKAQGFTESEVNRMVRRGVVTDKAMEVMEEYQGKGKLSYLNMRAAYMSDHSIANRVQQLKAEYQQKALNAKDPVERAKYENFLNRLKNTENIGTYDGMFLMSEETSQAFVTTREKRIQLGAGEELSDDIKKLISMYAKQGNWGNNEIDFATQNIMFDDWKTVTSSSGKPTGVMKKPKLLTNLGEYVDTRHGFQNGGNRLTISNVVREDLVRDAKENVIYDGNAARTEKKIVKQGQVYDKWYAGSTYIKGWDAENQTLVLEEQVYSMNSTKYITEGGHRATATLLPGEMIRDIAGGEAHAILPEFEKKKGMWGTELSRIVALAVDEAKSQIDGSSTGKLTAGSVGINVALDKINELFRTSFGIKDKALSQVKDGSIVVSQLLGKDDNMFYTLHNTSKFMSGVNEYLGTNFQLEKGTTFGNIGIGKQDVYDWENGIGMVDDNASGLVRYGRKEIDMVTQRANQVIGKGSQVTGWLQDYINQASRHQAGDIKQIGKGLVKVVTQGHDFTPDKGDVIIKTTGNGFIFDDTLDPEGRINDAKGISHGRVNANGAYEISMHALNDIPDITAKNMVTTAEAYAGTIVDFGRVKGTIVGAKNKKGEDLSFAEAITKNGGTAVLELPDDQSIAKRYLRLVDFGDITRGDTAMTPTVRELQKIQQQLWRNVKEYNSLGDGKREGDSLSEHRTKVIDRINELADQYEDKAARMLTNSRDGGIMKTLAAAKMDNSGRFRIQGVNPFANYEQGADGIWKQRAGANYEEGTIYLSRNRVREMITDDRGYRNKTTENIAKTMGINIGKFEGQKLVDEVLANINDKGLYGFVNRYPTIRQSTIQAMKVAIDDSIDPTDRTARLTVGTAHRLKADYDGDFLSTVLAHYSTDRFQVIHDELSKLSSIEAGDSRDEGSRQLADLHKDMESMAKDRGTTVQDLVKQYNEAEMIHQQMASGTAGKSLTKEQETLLTRMGNVIKTKFSNVDDALEAREARLGKEFVGLIDNTRDRVVNLATATVDALHEAGKFGTGINAAHTAASYRNDIENFLADFSQDAISAKKFNVTAEKERLEKLHPEWAKDEAETEARKFINNRYEKLQDMVNAVMNPTDENISLFKSHNKELELFKDEKKMNGVLDMIQKVAIWNNRSRGYFNMSLNMGQSEGKEAQVAGAFISGMGDVAIPTQAVKTITGLAEGETKDRLEASSNRWMKSLLQTYDRVENGKDDSLIDAMGRGFDPNDHVLSGATVAEEGHAKLSSMAGKFVPKLVSGGGLGGGALAFGAMWAASALIRSGPTPEGLQKQTDAPPPPNMVQQASPTARITQNNGEYVNIRVNAKNAQQMSEQDIAAIVHQELGAMTNTKLDTTLNVNDNTQNIDQQWLQGVVAKAISNGYGY